MRARTTVRSFDLMNATRWKTGVSFPSSFPVPSRRLLTVSSVDHGCTDARNYAAGASFLRILRVRVRRRLRSLCRSGHVGGLGIRVIGLPIRRYVFHVSRSSRLLIALDARGSHARNFFLSLGIEYFSFFSMRKKLFRC